MNVRCDEVRANPCSVSRDRRGDVRHLDRRHADRTLPDAREPSGRVALWTLVRIGHVARRLRDAKAGALPETEAAHPVAFAVEFQAIADGFEEDVAAALQRIGKREKARHGTLFARLRM